MPALKNAHSQSTSLTTYASPSCTSHSAPSSDFSAVKTFIRSVIANPRHMGTVCPSSRALARQIAAFIPTGCTGLIVELGAGTGPVTRAIVDRGFDPAQIVPIERNPELAILLAERFPYLRVVEGDACEAAKLLEKHLGADHTPVQVVVSCLPLKNLPKNIVERITQEAYKMLPIGGRLIQFTYDIRPNAPSPYKNFRKVGTKIVWANLPPVRVDVYSK